MKTNCFSSEIQQKNHPFSGGNHNPMGKNNRASTEPHGNCPFFPGCGDVCVSVEFQENITHMSRRNEQLLEMKLLKNIFHSCFFFFSCLFFFQKFHFQKLFIPPGHVGDISTEFNRKENTPPPEVVVFLADGGCGGVTTFKNWGCEGVPLLNSAEISPTCPGGMNNF